MCFLFFLRSNVTTLKNHDFVQLQLLLSSLRGGELDVAELAHGLMKLGVVAPWIRKQRLKRILRKRLEKQQKTYENL